MLSQSSSLAVSNDSSSGGRGYYTMILRLLFYCKYFLDTEITRTSNEDLCYESALFENWNHVR